MPEARQSESSSARSNKVSPAAFDGAGGGNAPAAEAERSVWDPTRRAAELNEATEAPTSLWDCSWWGGRRQRSGGRAVPCEAAQNLGPEDAAAAAGRSASRAWFRSV